MPINFNYDTDAYKRRKAEEERRKYGIAAAASMAGDFAYNSEEVARMQSTGRFPAYRQTETTRALGQDQVRPTVPREGFNSAMDRYAPVTPEQTVTTVQRSDIPRLTKAKQATSFNDRQVIPEVLAAAERKLGIRLPQGTTYGELESMRKMHKDAQSSYGSKTNKDPKVLWGLKTIEDITSKLQSGEMDEEDVLDGPNSEVYKQAANLIDMEFSRDFFTNPQDSFEMTKRMVLRPKEAKKPNGSANPEVDKLFEGLGRGK